MPLLRIALLLIGTLLPVALCQSTIEAFNIELVTGSVTQESSVHGQTAFVFFLPNKCQACDELSAWLHTVPLHHTKLVWVTNAPSDETERWATSQPQARNTWIDVNNEFAKAVHVEYVPSIYFFRDGLPVNQDQWPFFGGREGLTNHLVAFDEGEFAARFTNEPDSSITALQSLIPGDHTLTNLAGEQVELVGLGQPRLFVICTPECSVCEEEAAMLTEAMSEEVTPIDLTVILLTKGDGREGLSAWNKAPFPVLFLPADTAGELAVSTTPTHFSVTREGEVGWIQVGYTESMLDILAEQNSRLLERQSQ